jgi:hypothetical protein
VPVYVICVQSHPDLLSRYQFLELPGYYIGISALGGLWQDHPDKQMTVLCGHTDAGGVRKLLLNLVAYTGGGCYGLPVVQRIFGWDGRIVLTKTLFELSQRLPVPGFVHLSDIKR